MVMVTMDIDKIPTDFGRIDPGIYDAEVVKVEDGVAVKSGGYASRVTFRIVNDGPMHGREVNEQYNMLADNAKAKEIGCEHFSQMLKASGVPKENILHQNIDTQWALGRKMSIVLGPQKNDPQYVEVKAYMEPGARNDKANWDKVRDKIEGKPAGHGPSTGNAGGSWGNDNGGASPAQAAATPPVMPQGGGFAQSQPVAPQGGGFAQSQPAASSQQPQPQNTWGSSGGFAGPS
ncbi:DUF669 domain-containing protein [Acidithiobacillus sp. VAN18-1]|uniref:DUF669 domain-containing protein n=1 Tax=Igneacidithiobacillus copahuensis TaxID=2724909 RepID=A0AAE3CKB1_9PROT|nr:DUF669 domain-containing protein [Igneacidithiobacillus copahuensis]MBU2788616.1 DUF669 domain-containing protein [Igneacidithiobacillus copahuensis]MBU2796700.1 DUF669 domain-containing protein [Acidithiobacillus sp. VAN18-2]